MRVAAAVPALAMAALPGLLARPEGCTGCLLNARFSSAAAPRAAEDQLQRLPAELAPAVPGFGPGEEVGFMALRRLTAEHLRAHADEFRPFVLEVGVSMGVDV